MTDRVVLVTGAGQGIGLAIARQFAEEGDRVIATDIRPPPEGAAHGHCAAFIAQDVADEDQWVQLVRRVRSEFGALHILVNNAGTDGRADAPRDPLATPLDDWERVFAVNTRGCFLGCKHAAPAIAASGGGAIVNLASVAADVPTPFLTAYGASKAAVDHLTRSVALHCAQAGMRIRCNSVHPGQVRTPMLDELFERMSAETGQTRAAFEQQFLAGVPLGEFQRPEDIADAVCFLAGDRARMITGQALAVDGGFLLKH